VFSAGIELPQVPLAGLRDELKASCAALAGDDRLVIFACAHAAPLDAELRRNSVVARMPCIAMLPPSFIDFTFARRLADGVVLAGCPANACRERLGQRWTEERIAGIRDPWLRARVPRQRIAASWTHDLPAFRRALPGLQAFPAAAEKSAGAGLSPARARWPAPLRIAAMAVLLGMLAGVTALLAAGLPWRQLGPDEGVVRLSIRHATATKVECKPLTAREMAELKPNMRRPVDCPRERWPVYVELERDGRLLYRGTHEPSGLWNDGVASVHRAFAVPAGPQSLVVRMRDSGREAGFDHMRPIEIDLQPGQNFVIEFETGTGFSWTEATRKTEDTP
jgi:coenzyme F420-reducing hydrogenase delta subunit